MNRKKEFQYKRLFEVIKNRPNPFNKVWGLSALLKAINFLLPNHLTISSRNSLSGLIVNQQELKVFRCRFGKKGKYYIFKKDLPVGE